MAKTAKKPQWKLYRDEEGRYHAHPNPRTWDYATNKYVEGNTTEVCAADCEFVAPMKLESFSHYKSAHFYFKNLKNNHIYMMQGTEMEDILLNHTMEKGFIFGRWGWVKKGSVISIILLEEMDDNEEEGEVTNG